MEWREELGQQLKNARERRGYTQQQLADLVNTTRQSIIDYEKGHGAPLVPLFVRIAALLKEPLSIDGCLVTASETSSGKPQMVLDYDRDEVFSGATLRIRPSKAGITVEAVVRQGT